MTSTSSPAPIDLAWLSDQIPYRRYQECVHCGLCTSSCPTYVETATKTTARAAALPDAAVADGRLAMGPGIAGTWNCAWIAGPASRLALRASSTAG